MVSGTTRGLTVLLQLLTIRFKLLPSDVAYMDVLEEQWPCFLRHRLNVEGSIQPFAHMGSSIAERPIIARIPQNFQHTFVRQRRPMDRSRVLATTNTARKNEPMFAQILHAGHARA